MPKNVETARSESVPARMHSWAGAVSCASTLLESSEAASSTEPAAVTHDRDGDGERNGASAPSEVWVSSMSMKPRSHGSHTRSSRSSRPRMSEKRSSMVVPDGGVPA